MSARAFFPPWCSCAGIKYERAAQRAPLETTARAISKLLSATLKSRENDRKPTNCGSYFPPRLLHVYTTEIFNKSMKNLSVHEYLFS